ncbi:MAG: hypothetical protein ABJA76_11565 [Mucilaginibacter sp.]
MKQLYFMMTAVLLFSCKNQNQIDTEKFIAKRVSKTEVIQLNGNVEKVFPLFGAFEERKWADGWQPRLIYPSTEIIEEGTIFKTHGHGHHEDEFLWMVIKYQPKEYLVQYLVSTLNRVWTITVKCAPASNASSAQITYSYTGLNSIGNQINPFAMQTIYKHDLKDWEEAINYYLKTGKTLK